MKSVTSYLAKHPWIYIVLAFVLLAGAWATLISIAVKHSPQKIELRQ